MDRTGNSKTEYDDNEEAVGVFFDAWSLGYGKDDRGEWHLLIRKYKVPSAPSGTYTDPEDTLEEDTTPLLQASRDLRIAAAEKCPICSKKSKKKSKRKSRF